MIVDTSLLLNPTGRRRGEVGEVLVELSVMEQRYQAVMAVVQDGWTVTEVAHRLAVARQSVHNWIARYEAGGPGAGRPLAPPSSHIAASISAAIWWAQVAGALPLPPPKLAAPFLAVDEELLSHALVDTESADDHAGQWVPSARRLQRRRLCLQRGEGRRSGPRRGSRGL